MTKIIRGGYTLVYALLSVMLTLIIINSVFFISNIRKDYSFPLNPFVLLGISILLYLLVLFPLRKAIDKNNKLVIWIIVIIGIIIQLTVVVAMQGAQGVDDFDIRLQVAKFLNNDFRLDNYFIYASNNIPITFLFTGISKLASLLGWANHATLFLNIFQACLMDIAAGILMLILNRESNTKVATYALLIFVMFIPFTVYSVNLYTDVSSICFAIYGIEAFYYFYKNNNYWLILLTGILEGIAYLIKMNLIVMSISLVLLIPFLFKFNIKKLLKIFLVFATGFLLVSFSVNSLEKEVSNFSPEQIDSSRFPYTYWISMGLNSSYMGESGSGSWAEGNSLGSYKKRKKFYSTRIKQQVAPQNWVKLGKLYLKKVNIMYSQGDLGSVEKYFGISKQLGPVYQEIAGTKNTFYIIYSQMVYLFILMSSLVFSIKKLYAKNKVFGYFDIYSIFFIGIFLFHVLMWEVMHRYAFVAIFALIPLAAYGINDFIVIEENKNIPKYILIFSSLLLICGIGNDILRNLPIINKVPNREMTVVSQEFPEHDLVAINIPAKEKIEEHIYVPYSFKKINITYWAGGATLDSQPKLEMKLYSKSGKSIDWRSNTYKASGNYSIVIKNTSDENVKIAAGKSYKIDLLQEPIINHKNNYLNFDIVR